MPCPQCSPPGLYALSPASLTPCSYPLMLQCWAEDADERPTFEHLMTALLVCVRQCEVVSLHRVGVCV